jgi:hypothetical protein
VKAVQYSIGGWGLFPYKSPIRVKLDQPSFILAIADDNVANQSVYKFDFDRTGKQIW